MIGEALEAEGSELLTGFSEWRDTSGRAAMVRNGYQPERDIQFEVGPVTVKVPKARSRDGDPVSFHSTLVSPYVHKTAHVETAPWVSGRRSRKPFRRCISSAAGCTKRAMYSTLCP